jgi:hypothetical protein
MIPSTEKKMIVPIFLDGSQQLILKIPINFIRVKIRNSSPALVQDAGLFVL